MASIDDTHTWPSVEVWSKKYGVAVTWIYAECNSQRPVHTQAIGSYLESDDATPSPTHPYALTFEELTFGPASHILSQRRRIRK